MALLLHVKYLFIEGSKLNLNRAVGKDLSQNIGFTWEVMGCRCSKAGTTHLNIYPLLLYK